MYDVTMYSWTKKKLGQGIEIRMEAHIRMLQLF